MSVAQLQIDIAKDFTGAVASADVAAQDNTKALVNYMWITKDKDDNDPANPVCKFEMGNLALALANANKYPQADFRMWVDKNLMDDYTLLCVEQFMAENAKHGNIKLHDLQEIADYAKDEYFVPLDPTSKGYATDHFNRRGPRNVYSRADYARILVLDHCMRECRDHKHIIYTDLDCPDVRLAETQPLMDKYGIAMYDFSGMCVSNGYIGLNRENAAIAKHFPSLKSSSRVGAHHNFLGFSALASFLNQIDMPNFDWHGTIGVLDLLPLPHTKVAHLEYTPPLNVVQAWKKKSGLG